MRYELVGYGKPKMVIWGEHDTYDSAALTVNDLKQLQEKIPELIKLIEDNTAHCKNCKHWKPDPDKLDNAVEGWCSVKRTYVDAEDECCDAYHGEGDP